jgi:hypothetical protein
MRSVFECVDHAPAAPPLPAFEAEYEASVYFFAAVSAGLWLVWIFWIPFLGLLAPSIGSAPAVTTISDTFKAYSTVSTIYLVVPSSVLLLLRVYRTYKAPALSRRAKKRIAVLLVFSQVLLFVIIRYDSIKGWAHFACVFCLVGILVLYHANVQYVPQDSTGRVLAHSRRLKLGGAVSSVLFLAVFGMLVVFVNIDPAHDPEWYTVACLCEILGVMLLGMLDVVDIASFARSCPPRNECAAVRGFPGAQALDTMPKPQEYQLITESVSVCM